MRCELATGDGGLLLDPDAVEDDVRYGRVTLDDRVRVVAGGRPVADPQQWPAVGEWRAVRDIAALADAARAPAAVLGERFRHPPRAWMFGAIALSVGAVFLAQALLGDALPLRSLALGFVPSLVDAGWWTPWTASLLHVNLFHLLLNLPILLYCGWRVERVMGAAGLLLVAAAAVLGATPLVAWLSALPVVGASIVAYGLWGAQIALGLRLGERIPVAWRGRYGFGNLVLFVPLFVSSLGAPGVSDLGHIGGLVGGVIAAILAPLEGTAADPRAVRRRVLGLVAAVGVAPCLGLAIAARSPTLLGFPSREVVQAEHAYTLVLPERLAAHELRVGGMPAWSLTREVDLPLFAGLLLVPRDTQVDGEAFARFWSSRLGGEVTPLPDSGGASPIGEGWSVHHFAVAPVSAFPAGATLTQHARVSGRYAWGVGWFVPSDRALSPGQEAWYTAIGATIRVGDPPELVAARARFDRDSDATSARYALALELSRSGKYAEMAAVLAPLAERVDGAAWDAMRVTLDAWDQDPSVSVDEATLRRMAEEAPAVDLALLRPAFDWFLARGDCAAAGGIAAKLGGFTLPDDAHDRDRARLTAEVDRQRAELAGCPRSGG